MVDTSIVVPVIDFRETPLREAIEALARSYEVDLWIDPKVSGDLTVRLTEVRLNDALMFIIKNNSLGYDFSQGIARVYPKPADPPGPPVIEYTEGKLTLAVDAITPVRLATLLTETTDQNVLVESGVGGVISGHIDNASFESGLTALLASNGYELSKSQGIYCIHAPTERDVPSRRNRLARSIRCENDWISFEVSDMELQKLLEQIARACDLQLFLYGTINGKISANCSDLSTRDALAFVLNGTNYTFKVENGVYFVGDKSIDEISTSEVITFHHVVAKDLIELIPQNLSQQVTVKSSVEQNAIVLWGPYAAVREISEFLRPLDEPPAQILIEALVVDYSTTTTKELGMTSAILGLGDSLSGQDSYYPYLELERTGPELQDGVEEWASHLGIHNIGTLSENFFVQLRALVHEGIANIRSRPQIAALNGHTASIHIGTTQYYLLETETVHSSGQPSLSTQVAQRFETIDADISFEVTPWVTASNEIIVDIKPEFKTPQGAFDPDTPPTINRRLLQSTVRLRNGETIVLGGLIQSGNSESIDKFPILGSLPVVGRIFQNRRTVATKNELVIYLTPHIHYGEEGNVEPNEILKH